MKKRILAAVMAAAMLALGMAGCGSSNNSSNSENNEASTTAASAEKTKITFVLDWTPNTNHGVILLNLLLLRFQRFF